MLHCATDSFISVATADQSSLIRLMKRRKLRLPVRPDGHFEVLCFPSFNQVEANICLRLWNLSSMTMIDRRHLRAASSGTGVLRTLTARFAHFNWTHRGSSCNEALLLHSCASCCSLVRSRKHSRTYIWSGVRIIPFHKRTVKMWS